MRSECQSGRTGGMDRYGKGGDTEANGVCYAGTWATNRKDGGGEARIQEHTGEDAVDSWGFNVNVSSQAG